MGLTKRWPRLRDHISSMKLIAPVPAAASASDTVEATASRMRSSWLSTTTGGPLASLPADGAPVAAAVGEAVDVEDGVTEGDGVVVAIPGAMPRSDPAPTRPVTIRTGPGAAMVAVAPPLPACACLRA